VIEISRRQDSLRCHRESDEQILLLLLDVAPSVAHTLRLPLTFEELLTDIAVSLPPLNPSDTS